MEKRKEFIKRACDEYVQNLPDPEQPPGHRKLSNEERTSTLNLLQESKKFF